MTSCPCRTQCTKLRRHARHVMRKNPIRDFVEYWGRLPHYVMVRPPGRCPWGGLAGLAQTLRSAFASYVSEAASQCSIWRSPPRSPPCVKGARGTTSTSTLESRMIGPGSRTPDQTAESAVPNGPHSRADCRSEASRSFVHQPSWGVGASLRPLDMARSAGVWTPPGHGALVRRDLGGPILRIRADSWYDTARGA